MESGRDRLLGVARSLLAEHPAHEPSTRELYEAAGVTAPTLYHHFGTKEGLLQAVVESAFAAYLERKRSVPRSGDLLGDFAAGWDMHVEFGVQNPVLYRFMYGSPDGRRCPAAQRAQTELRHGLERLADAGLLRMGVDEAAAVTTGMAIGCVTQLVHDGGSATGPVARSIRAALVAELTGRSPQNDDPRDAAQLLLARLGVVTESFSSAEKALLGQWLHTIAGHDEQVRTAPRAARGGRER